MGNLEIGQRINIVATNLYNRLNELKGQRNIEIDLNLGELRSGTVNVASVRCYMEDGYLDDLHVKCQRKGGARHGYYIDRLYVNEGFIDITNSWKQNKDDPNFLIRMDEIVNSILNRYDNNIKVKNEKKMERDGLQKAKDICMELYGKTDNAYDNDAYGISPFGFYWEAATSKHGHGIPCIKIQAGMKYDATTSIEIKPERLNEFMKAIKASDTSQFLLEGEK